MGSFSDREPISSCGKGRWSFTRPAESSSPETEGKREEEEKRVFDPCMAVGRPSDSFQVALEISRRCEVTGRDVSFQLT